MITGLYSLLTLHLSAVSLVSSPVIHSPLTARPCSHPTITISLPLSSHPIQKPPLLRWSSRGQGQLQEVPGGAGSSLVPLSAAASHLQYSKALSLRDGSALHPLVDILQFTVTEAAAPLPVLLPVSRTSSYLSPFSSPKSQPMHLSGAVSPSFPSVQHPSAFLLLLFTPVCVP